MRGAVRLACALLVAGTSLIASADEALDSLLKKLPASTNSIVIINAKKVFDSPLAKLQQWAAKNANRFATGANAIPPNVDLAVLGAQIDDQTLKTKAECGIVWLRDPADIGALAIRERGKVETISGLPSVQSARNGYFGLFGPNQVGFMFPAVRRDYAKWLRIATTSDRVTLSKYLQEAAAVAGEAPIVVAFDAEDAMDEIRAMHALKGCSAEAMPGGSMEECARVLGSIRGLTFAVQVNDAILGKVKIDFDRSAKPLEGHAKELFVELLNNQGMLIDDFKNWTARVEGSSISIGGPMTPVGLRQLLAIVTEVPSGAFEGDLAGQGGKPGPSEGLAAMNPQLAASQKYFKTTQDLLDDLRNFRFQTTGQYATMHERYATKIDRLPIYNVDDQLLNYGAGIGNHLRAVAMSLRGANIQAGIIDTSRPTTGSYIGFGGYGIGTGGTVDSSAYFSARKQAVAVGTQARLDQWSAIEQESAQIRRIMVEKYKADF